MKLMFRVQIREEIRKIVGEGSAFSVERPENPEHGDYSSNIALIMAKKEGKNPREVAESLKTALGSEASKLGKIIEKIEIAGPGFLNFFLKKETLSDELNKILENPKKFGTSNIGKGKKVIVEYFQLNVGKPSHVGHLRSAVIGDALKRSLLSQGYDAISDTHVGDWGTQFGILIRAYKNADDNFKQILVTDIFSSARAYAEANIRAEENPKERELAKEEFAKLEAGDSEDRKIWKDLLDNSMKSLYKNAERLNLLPFEENLGESFYEDKMKPIIDVAINKKIAKRLDDGAVVIDLTSDNLDEAVLIKSDGASTYLLRDLATIKYRKEEWKFDKNIYVVDVRQSHHFKQVFKVAELLGFEGVGESEHVSYGFMSLPKGAISTRKGTAILLDAVLDEAEKRAMDVIKEKNPELENKEEVAKQVGIGALKYFDLSHNRHSDIVFKWDEALSFDGNTGPYLQYAHARFKSILRKVDGSANREFLAAEFDQLERNFLVAILYFPEIIEDALEDYMPNILANYLYELAQLANNFYHSHQVLQEEDKWKQQFRIALIKAFTETLKNGLNLLGISAPEKM
ncbi:MAG: arginine--tRNA ligase [bacterium]|nr:arginine--tRNA ligase [bacterium]